ncbi:MAG: hypothetical protein AVDCRST_MAG68-977, partial [uncultured Gemmatimonadetes bacterium]
ADASRRGKGGARAGAGVQPARVPQAGRPARRVGLDLRQDRRGHPARAALAGLLPRHGGDTSDPVLADRGVAGDHGGGPSRAPDLLQRLRVLRRPLRPAPRRGGAGPAWSARGGGVGGRGAPGGGGRAVARGFAGALPRPSAAAGRSRRRALRPLQDPRRLPPRAARAPRGGAPLRCVPARVRAGGLRRAAAGRRRVRAAARRGRRGGRPWV